MKKSKLDLTLITRYLLNESDNKEKHMIRNIIDNDEESRRQFDEYLDLWENSANLKDFDKIDDEKDWKMVRQRMNFNPSVKTISKRTYIYAIAAVLIIALGLTFLIARYINNNNSASEYYETASLNQKKQVVLSDGSVISLNRNSKIIRNSDFGKSNRDIILEGEAFLKWLKTLNFHLKYLLKIRPLKLQVLALILKVIQFRLLSAL